MPKNRQPYNVWNLRDDRLDQGTGGLMKIIWDNKLLRYITLGTLGVITLLAMSRDHSPNNPELQRVFGSTPIPVITGAPDWHLSQQQEQNPQITPTVQAITSFQKQKFDLGSIVFPDSVWVPVENAYEPDESSAMAIQLGMGEANAVFFKDLAQRASIHVIDGHVLNIFPLAIAFNTQLSSAQVYAILVNAANSGIDQKSAELFQSICSTQPDALIEVPIQDGSGTQPFCKDLLYSNGLYANQAASRMQSFNVQR